MPNVTYPLDLTGVAPTNLIENELHTVSESHYRDYFFIVPNFSPFYIDNFSAKITVNGNTRELVEDVDFSFAIPYIAGTRTTGKAMYGAITLHNLEMNGILSITYQTVGGDQVADRLYVLTILADKAYNPRTTIWELLTNVPNAFPPLPHYQDYDNFYGQEEVVNGLGAIRDAIANSSVDIKSKLHEVLQLLGPGGLLNFLPLSGGKMTGDLILNDDPHTDLQAATKRYVDSNIINQSSLANILSNYVDRDYFTRLVDELKLFVIHNSSSSAFYEELRNLKVHLEQKLHQQILPNYLTRTQFNELASDLKLYVHYITNRIGSYQGEVLTYAALLEVLKDYVTNDTLTNNYLNTEAITTLIDELNAKINKNSEDIANIFALLGQNANQSQIDAINTTVTTLNTDPVTKNYVDQGLATKVNKAGDTMMGYLTLFGDPTEPLHAATKQYVDAVAQGLSVKPSVRLATTENLDATYNNGNQGVGATLQANSNGALVIDGVTPIVGDRILVKSQTNKKENGDYVVTQVGSDTTPYILKRDKFYDENYEIPGSYFYVYDGQTLKGTGWVALVANPVTFLIGQDEITVTQFFGQGTYIPGNGITIDGTTISVVTADSSRIVSLPGYIDLAPTGVNPGTYTKVIVDGFGRVLNGSNPTTLAGYGISDGQPLNANLTSLSNLTANGIVVRDNTNSMVAKAIGVEGTGLTITNGSGANNGDIVIKSNATSENTPATIVARDDSGNFAAGVITAELNGNASSASKLANSQNFSVTGDATTVTPVSFNGTGPVQLNIKLNDTGVTPGQYTRVVVGSDGRITLADNPTTVSDLGLIDAATISYVNSQINALNQRINDLYTYVLQRLG